MGLETYGTVPLDFATQALVAAMTVRPDRQLMRDLDQCIKSLKYVGLWDTYDRLYLSCVQNVAAAALNAIDPTIGTLTQVNSPTFTANQGWTGNGTTSYLDLGVAPSGLTKFIQDNGCLGTWSLSALASATKAMIGANDLAVANGIVIIPRFSSDLFDARINGVTAGAISNSSSSGYFVASRISGTTLDMYKDGVSVGSPASASTGRSAVNIYWLAQNNNGAAASFSNHQSPLMHIGSALTADQIAKQYGIFQRLLAARGNSV